MLRITDLGFTTEKKNLKNATSIQWKNNV